MEIDCGETSASAFINGGIQDACDDACSICLENFTESDPPEVTNCNHQYHLQCILEWCQRSSNCPMCWRQISLKECTSQELIEAVENEKKMTATASRSEFHVPSNASDAEIEDRILQHLAAAMGSQYQFPRRRGASSRFIVFSPATSPPVRAASSSSVHERNGNERARPLPLTTNNITNYRNSSSQISVVGNETAGPSEFQAISESFRSRFSSLSMRKYKESTVRSTRSWKERIFAHTNSVADPGSEVRREGRNHN